MTPQEVELFLRAHAAERLRATFSDGVVWSVDIDSVDDEGFLHSGPNGENARKFWTRFEGITDIST
jgi:hypothetical protein